MFTSSIRRTLVICTLIVSGETIFLLPFVLVRIFRPTFLAVFDVTNLQLGISFSLYGVIAMFSYFFGGPLADRFSARKLMTIAMIITSFGGVLLVSKPEIDLLIFLYGFWGLTTILIFWAALIRATREWGGYTKQGIAFGILDGGRGLYIALLAAISVAIFASYLPDDPAMVTLEHRTMAFNNIIWIFK